MVRILPVSRHWRNNNNSKRYYHFAIVAILLLVILPTPIVVNSQEAATAVKEESTNTNTSTPDSLLSQQQQNDTESTSSKQKRTSTSTNAADDFDVKNENWGTYYDPNNIFCGKYDCYKILGFDYEMYDKVKPTTKEITKRYRQLSRYWHPDKNKAKNAKQKFVKIVRAYEVLTTKDTREEYDKLRYDPGAYYEKYGSNVLWSYAPQSDVLLVILLLLVIGNVASWYIQKHRWQLVADRLIKAAVEDWSPRDGGTPESKQLREEATAILAQREADATITAEAEASNGTATANGDSTVNGTAKASSSKKKNKAAKVPGREKKKLEQEALVPIITELVNAMDDFGGGFHKPTYQDLMIVSLLKLPYKLVTGSVWQIQYRIRRLRNIPLSDDEKLILTQYTVGPIVWSTATDDDKQDMINKELWIKENLYNWQEEQEIKQLSASEQKYYMKLKKKGKLDKLE